MGNFRKAPVLEFKGKKFIENNQQHYEIPQDIADIVFKEIGANGAQLRIMLLLIGTKEGFGISEAWVFERTGLGHSSYDRARKALIALGWITLSNGKIIVNYDTIRGPVETLEATLQEEEKQAEPQTSFTAFDF